MSGKTNEFRMKLSGRMQVIADHVSPGDVAADIGTDHGQIPVWLYGRGICPRVILTDISEGSLEKARETAAWYGLDAGLSFRTGNGLQVLDPGEADTVIIAGMGGKLIRQILEEDVQHTCSFRKFILQPRKGQGPLRQWLLAHRFAIVCEDVVHESHFMPEIITTISPAFREDVCEAASDMLPEREDAAHEPDPDRDAAVICDLSAGYRQMLLELEEQDIRLRVPPWMSSAHGPLEEYLALKRSQEQMILDNMRRAKVRDLAAERRVQENIAYLERLQQSELTNKDSTYVKGFDIHEVS